MIRKIQRAAVDTWLKASRMPLDRGAKLMGEEAEVAVDRADAEVRDAAGRLLFNDELREDARLRRAAAKERGEALRLRATAAETSQEAEQDARRRKANVARAEAQREERIESTAKRERLDALERKAEALDRRADASTARDEALRLRRAAADAKAERKERAKRV